MKEIFDEFPSNINETKGKIERNSFIFESTSYIVYQGIVVKSEKVNLRIIGTISDNLIFVKIKNNPIPNFINDTFNFGEISHSLDRVIWSKDIYNLKNHHAYLDPDFCSMYFKNGILVKIGFNIFNPPYLIEFIK